ncbi:TIGR00153 family protein [Thermodesulforhabdus norvegica]|uniref:TIGR00153 family protein n=1 Tax=Thermodesulforhabdus norvegica TaxID=39841 RepID=A0A1I4QXC2_9BACT|nr:TIGR00153 family protein [Thermodesulforhabdus norvegica]SFM44350.1 hypothetical protein SAMN05660836_00259 [Thermodesulforhabdus norvegica]
MFKRIFTREQREEVVLENIQEHLGLLIKTCKMVDELIRVGNRTLVEAVEDLERQADEIRRTVFAKLFEGAFIPYLRPHIYRFTEIVDEAVDKLEDVARYMELIKIPPELFDNIVSISEMNTRMAELLDLTFQAFRKGEDLREKVLAIRVYEKRIDDLDHLIKSESKYVKVDNFWDGRWLSEFLESLSTVSDYLEDAADVLSLIRLSLA